MSSRRHFRRHTGADEPSKKGLWLAIIGIAALAGFLWLVRPTPFG